MKLLTILEKNRPGLLAEVMSLLADAKVDVRDIDGESTGDQAVITVRAVPFRRAHRVLADAGYKVFTADHLLVRIEDQPGALATLSRSLADANVGIRSIHFVERETGQCIVALETADPERAGQVLADRLVGAPGAG